MFGFSNDCKKDIKINIMLNALMEYDTNDIEKVIAFFHGNSCLYLLFVCFYS